MTTWISGALSTFACAVALCVAAPALAQEKVGVVTTVVGPVTVARASLPPEPLKFKDDVFVRDLVTTGEDAITRILLGGKVIITARERSTLTITETPGLSTIHLTAGRIAVAVERARMKPGERVDIRTPNAVAGVRGTVLIVEAAPSLSTVTVLRGLVHVTRLNSVTGIPVGRYTAVGARQTVTVRNGVLPARSKAIAPIRAQELAHEFTPPLKAVTSAAVIHETDEIKRVLAKSDVSGPQGSLEGPVHRRVKATKGAEPAAPPLATTAPSAGETGTLATTPAPAATPAVATAPVASPAPVLATAPPVATPPVLSTTPVLTAAPVLSSPPMPVVTAPAPAPAPASIKTNSPNWGSSWKHSSSKYDKDDRSGSNRGRR
jgi:hypothetical protein